MHTAAYIYRGPLQLRIWEERDPQTQELVAIRQYTSTYEQNRTIWMDGRPHPPDYAAHTWMGFSTGQVGRQHPDGLHHAHQAGLAPPQRDSVERQDHADGAFHPARQPPDARERGDRSGVSDRAADQERRLRARIANSGGNWLWPCEYVEELPGADQTEVPSFMPGENPFVHEFADKHGTFPVDAAAGRRRRRCIRNT